MARPKQRGCGLRSANGATDDATPAAVCFAYTPGRKGIHPHTHLANFRGVLQTDAYAGFNALYVDGTIQEAACWTHPRRKFHDLHAAKPSAITNEALRRVAELYVIEAESRGKPPYERQSVRQQRSRPLPDDLGNWLRATLEKAAAQFGHGSGDPVRAQSVAGAAALLRQRRHRDRQLDR